MKNITFTLIVLLFSFNAWTFETGQYTGSNSDVKCTMDVDQQADRVLIDYDCLTTDGVIFQSGITQTYMFGSFSQEVEDESGSYIVSGSASEKLLEYKIVKTSANNSTWLEQIKNLENGKIIYSMSMDNVFWINLDLAISK